VSRLAVASALLAAVLTSAGCSLDYEAAETPQGATESIPDTVAVGITHRIVKNSRLSFEMEASRAETYNARKETILKDARFTEFDDTGAHTTEGKAATVVFHTDTENAEISGSVSVYSAGEKGRISTQALSWQNKQKILTADPGARVTIRKDDGSFLTGTGFTGDFRTKEVRFSGPVEGTYVYEK
jgi:LPS export ABC transporter protein LptC